MIMLTWSAVMRSEHANTANGTFDLSTKPVYTNKPGYDAFTTAVSVISCLVAIFYILLEGVRVFRGKMELHLGSFTNDYSNAWFRVMSVIMSASLLIDFLATVSPYYENYCLTLAVIFGWFFMLFFLRAARPFSFFTLLIQRVLLDMARFFVIIALEILAFGTALYMFIQGSEITQEVGYNTYWKVLVSLVQLMVGLGDVPDFYNTRNFTLTIATFILFIIMTTLLMINALIALMGDTCTELVQNGGSHEPHWKMQRLSTILFIESVLPNKAVRKIGENVTRMRFNNAFDKRNKMSGYKLQIVSLQNDENTQSSIRSEFTNMNDGKMMFDMATLKRKRKCPRTKQVGAQTESSHYFKQTVETPSNLDIFEARICTRCNSKGDLKKYDDIQDKTENK